MPPQEVQTTANGIAVDFGGTKIVVARLRAGVMVDHRRLVTDANADANQQITTVAEAIDSLGPHPHERIAVAATGRIDQEGRWYTINKQTLSAVNDIPLQQRLSDLFQRPVNVINDAVAGALGEAHSGAGRGCQRFAYVTVSTGVGGCCILEGVPLLSPNGLAGNIGFMSSRGGTERCGSGRLGTIESIASGNAIARSAERIGHLGLTAKDVFELGHSGAPWAESLIRDSAVAIAELGSNLATVTGVTRLVVGGSVGLAKGYRELVIAAMRNEPELFRLDVVSAELGQESVLVGALVFKSSQSSVINKFCR